MGKNIPKKSHRNKIKVIIKVLLVVFWSNNVGCPKGRTYFELYFPETSGEQCGQAGHTVFKCLITSVNDAITAIDIDNDHSIGLSPALSSHAPIIPTSVCILFIPFCLSAYLKNALPHERVTKPLIHDKFIIDSRKQQQASTPSTKFNLSWSSVAKISESHRTWVDQYI